MRVAVAEDGKSGVGRDRTGRKGKRRSLNVPVGTVVWEVDEEGGKTQLADLTEPGMQVIGARGGEQGRGNHRFATATNQEPMLAEAGDAGEERRVLLEVKLLADVGIVGAPNAGKSTLLAAISRAKPKIADYPFTTIEPVLGVVDRRGRRLVVLDVPGLVEGAHEGKGLGLEFLRHVERVRTLVHLVDGTESDVASGYRRIAAELDAYPGGLSDKPRIVVLNKVDDPVVREAREEKTLALEAASGERVLVISGAGGIGLDALLDRMWELVPEEKGAVEVVAEVVAASEVPRRVREHVSVERDKEVFVVTCRQAERFAPKVNFGNWRARLQFHAELERLGVIDALEKAGVESGDTVRIAGCELEWD
jgi:GTP-binding protein